jgi:hypothetical protein
VNESVYNLLQIEWVYHSLHVRLENRASTRDTILRTSLCTNRHTIRIRFGAKEDRNDISLKRKEKIMFSGKLNRVQFKIEMGTDSYRAGNRTGIRTPIRTLIRTTNVHGRQPSARFLV